MKQNLKSTWSNQNGISRQGASRVLHNSANEGEGERWGEWRSPGLTSTVNRHHIKMIA